MPVTTPASTFSIEPVSGSSTLRGRLPLRRFLQRQPVSPADLCMPLLVHENEDAADSVVPTVSLQRLSVEVRELRRMGIGSVKIFCGGSVRDDRACEAASPDNLMNRAIATAKEAAQDMAVMTENCLCSYTHAGNCFLTNADGVFDYEGTLTLLSEQAVQQADAGADIVGPAAMIDGVAASTRQALNQSGHRDVGIMPHVIFTSRLYDGYRRAMNAVPARGNRRAFQIHPSCPEQAVALARDFLAEGADMLLLEPALHSLDVLVSLRQAAEVPLVPFSVSGEYAELTRNGTLKPSEYRAVLLERLTMFKRAGATTIITYAAKQAAGNLEAS
nr:hypothetical protein [Nocardiopsis mwathae]